MGNKLTHRRPAIDDCYTRPQGLYPSQDVDQRKLRRLILDSKLAPCYPGGEAPAVELEECPICFLHYPSLNRSKCCTKGICTECFLQMKSPNVTRPTQYPFCFVFCLMLIMYVCLCMYACMYVCTQCWVPNCSFQTAL
jgi:hypothetical protein